VVVVDIGCGLQLHDGIDGGGSTDIQFVGACKGAPHFGHVPIWVYMIIYPF